MLGFTVLFAVLASIASANPLPKAALEGGSSGLAERDIDGPWRFSHYYADHTVCWVDGRRGWVKDQTCGNLIDVDANIAIGKRGLLDGLGGLGGLGGIGGNRRKGDYAYYADGLPCFNQGREGLLADALCVVADLNLDLGNHHSDYYPYRFNRFYNDRTPCWVDNRRGYVHDGYCSNLVDIDADIKIGRRSRSDNAAYYADGVPCWKGDKEGLLKDDVCVGLDVDVHVKRQHLDYYNDYRRPGLTDGAACYRSGRAGIVKDTLCIVADLHIGKRLFSDGLYRHGPLDGDKCQQNGRWGTFRDALCVIVDIQVKRDLLGGLVDTITGHDHGDHFDRYGRYHKFASGSDRTLADVDADVIVGNDDGHRRIYARGLLGGGGDGPLNGIGSQLKGLNKVTKGLGIKNRDLLGLGGDRYAKHRYGQGEIADIDADVTVGGEGRDGYRRIHSREMLGGLGHGKSIDGPVKSVKGLLGGVGLKKKDLLGLGKERTHRYGGYGYRNGEDGVLADVAAVVELNGDRSNYGHGNLLNHVVRQEEQDYEQDEEMY